MNSVPPTQMLLGVEARPETVAPPVAAALELLSEPAAPLSPAATRAVIPWAAAWAHRFL